MDDHPVSLDQAYGDYRLELEACQRKLKPTDGLFGFGRGLKDDACHDRFDERVRDAVTGLANAGPTPAETEKAVRELLLRDAAEQWPSAAQWMLIAVQRHVMPLICLLDGERAGALAAEYEKRWPRGMRLPIQNDILKALKRVQTS